MDSIAIQKENNSGGPKKASFGKKLSRQWPKTLLTQKHMMLLRQNAQVVGANRTGLP